MAETATLQLVHTTGDGERLGSGALVNITGEQLIKEDVALINGMKTTPLNIITAGLKSIYMLSDKAVSCVFEKADDSTVATIALAANIPWAWNDQDPSAANPFGFDIASVESTAAAVGTLQIRVIQNVSS